MSDQHNKWSLINLNLGDLATGLTKPGVVFIEKVSNAVGAIYKPFGTVSNALADGLSDVIRAHFKGQAKIIQTQAAIKVTTLKVEGDKQVHNTAVYNVSPSDLSAIEQEVADQRERAIIRFISEETKQQSNMEAIVGAAALEVREDAHPEKMDDDWIVNLLDKGRRISNEKAQLLWAKVLAQEANAPGTISKHTVNILAAMDSSDGDKFSAVCRFAASLQTDPPFPLILDHLDAPIYANAGATFAVLSHLSDIGLVRLAAPAGYHEPNLPKQIKVEYFDETKVINMANESGNKLFVGYVIFTEAGQALHKLCKVEKVDGFLDYLGAEWARHGLYELASQ